MGRLIELDAAIKATWKDTGYTDPLNVMTAIRDRLEALPTVDAVEVVRCKDCKYWRRDTDHTCKEHSLVSPMIANGFCSLGKRKDVTNETD